MEPAVSSRSGRSGFTLLEVLVAVALLLALFGLALPNVMSSLEERAFESAAEMTIAHLLLARAEAQRSARPIEVRYVANEPRLEARPFELDGAVIIVIMAEPAEEDSDTGFGVDALDEEEPVAILPEAWAYRPLPDGVRITLAAPETPEEIDPLDDAFEDEPPEEEEETAFLLAVFLPDGSVLVGDEVWIRGADGRTGRLRLNGWTGLPRFERVTAEDLRREADEADEDDESEEDDESSDEPWLDEDHREPATAPANHRTDPATDPAAEEESP